MLHLIVSRHVTWFQSRHNAGCIRIRRMEMQLKMKNFILIALLSICFCPWTAMASEKPFAGTELNFLMISGHRIGLESRLPKFEEETGIKVNLIPVSMPDLYKKLGTEFATESDSYDAIEIMWAAAQGYARAEKLLLLDSFMDKYGLDVNQYSSVYVKNHMIQYPQSEGSPFICLPHQADIQILAYRADLFEDPNEMQSFQAQFGYALGAPKTYKEFLDLATFFTRDSDKDGNPEQYGTVVLGKNFPSLVGDITPYIRGFGGDWLNKQYQPIINSPESVAGIQYYVDLHQKYHVTPGGVATYSWGEAITDFQNGKISMMVIWPGQVVALEKKDASRVAGKIKYAPIPGQAPTVGGWAVAIPKTAKNPEASFHFLQWLTSEKIAMERARETGFSTAVQALYSDPAMNQKFKYLPAFEASLDNGQGWPQIGEFTSIWQMGAQELSRVFAGDLEVKEAADILQKSLDRLMQDGGYY